MQEIIGLGFSAVGVTISKFLNDPESFVEEDMSALVDGKFFCVVPHSMSIHRRYDIVPILKSEVRKVIQCAEVEE